MAEAGFQKASPCKLCENPVQYQCQNCDDPLCTSCKQSHEREKPHHKYVPYSQKARTICTRHNDLKYFFWCESCKDACCTKCAITIHRGHDMTYIEDAICAKQIHVKEHLKGPLKNNLKEWQILCTETRQITKEYIAQIQKLDNQLISHAARIHEAVDENLAKVRRELQAIGKSAEAVLQKQEEEINDRFGEIKRIYNQAEDHLESNDISILLERTLEDANVTVLPTLIRHSPPSYSPGEINDQNIMTVIGQLNSTNQSFKTDDLSHKAQVIPREKHLSQPLIKSSFDTGYKEPHIVCTTSSGLAWIKTGDKRLHLMERHGTVLDTIVTDFEFYGVTITPQGDVLFTDSANRRIVSASNVMTSWKIKTLFSTERRPWRISCTRGGDVIVTYSFFPDHRVIQYDNDGTIVHEYDPNLFSSPNTAAVNKFNDNVYIRDGNKHKVFVFGKDHNLLYEYTGSHNESFHPGGVTTDTSGRVLITDMKNNRIHILDKDGKFIRYLHPSGLEKPCYVDVDNGGNVWIGGYNGKVEILKYC